MSVKFTNLSVGHTDTRRIRDDLMGPNMSLLWKEDVNKMAQWINFDFLSGC
jgi:hypothetical protein